MKEEPIDHETIDLYGRLLRMTHEEVFRKGHCFLLAINAACDSSFTNFIGYLWEFYIVLQIIVVNLGSFESQGFLPLIDRRECESEPSSFFSYRDELTGQEYASNYKDIVRRGLYIFA
ncbi:MAG: hypothetical protein NPIRA05_19880 [Nitrospirales bacterium]|nr:MAG: hypothetical protein NPIRA05_19880 [Nitrospirales bacterium]